MNQKTKSKQNIRNKTSRVAGLFAEFKHPKFYVNWVIEKWKKVYNISMDEYVIPDGGFQNFNEFFTRKLKPECRPILDGIVSPVDCSIFDYGYITPLKRIHVKGRMYNVHELTNEEESDMQSYCVFYLSPCNYHRVHACFDMKINKITYHPGTLFSVKEKTIKKRERVYCKNERIILHGDSDYGKFQFIFVGAMMVGKVKLSFEKNIETNIKKGKYFKYTFDTYKEIKKGEELGYFEMGSSVILLLENNYLANIFFRVDENVKMGESIFIKK